MAILRVLGVHDSKVEGFIDQPFVAKTAGEALRSWEHLVNDPKTQMYRNPEDFVLYELAEYDSNTGKFNPHDVPRALSHAKEVKRAVPAVSEE